MAEERGSEQNIIIKKVKKVSGGHHGGAWKIAYADFVTAMMAFFLLMWLLNVSSEEQRKGIADYTPSFVGGSKTQPHDGKIGLMSGFKIVSETKLETKNSDDPDSDDNEPKGNDQEEGSPGKINGKMKEGEKDSTEDNLNNDKKADEGKGGESAGVGIEEEGSGFETEEQLERAEKKAIEKQRFVETIDNIKRHLDKNPGLKDLKKHVDFKITDQGLSIKILDQDKRSMFPSGSDALHAHAQKLLTVVSESIEKLPNKISIKGHTDAKPYASTANYTNWELSVDRANAARRHLIKMGVAGNRVVDIVGKADTDPFIKGDPFDPRNRRLSIMLYHTGKGNSDKKKVKKDKSEDEFKPRLDQKKRRKASSEPREAKKIIIAKE